MTLTTPTPFVEAMESLLRRRVLPTNLTTPQIQQLDDKVRRESFFSAQTLMTELLEAYKADVESIVSPKRVERAPGVFVTEGVSVAQARQRAKELLGQLGYQPDPNKRGTIQDLSSDRRINLVVETNAAIAQGEGWWLQGQDPDFLDAWPAQELFRAENRKAARDWTQRWMLAGQQTGDPIGTGWTVTPGRQLIALKNHAIWDRLGDPALFADGLGNPFPPFAFASGMDVRDVTRRQAVEIGLIAPGEQVQPKRVEELLA